MAIRIFQVLGALGMFLYGMKLMTEGIQKTAGNRMKSVLDFMTINRFTAVFTGSLVTATIQSSSATTVMVVSLVNAGLFNLTQAIGVILGANIGTTLTGWVIAIIGFKFNISVFALPAIAIATPFIFIAKWGKQSIGEMLLGFGLLFLGLSLMKDSVPDINSHPEALEFLRNYTGRGFYTFVIFVLAGTLTTMIVQASSATMAVTITMAFYGWIDLSAAAYLVLGENIGTTITAYIASMGTNVTARRAARAHTLFNVIGVLWMAVFFTPFLSMIMYIIPGPAGDTALIPARLALFHTMFNLVNTAVFVPFVGPFARLVAFLVKPRKDEETARYKLVYTATSARQAPEINILKAETEIKKMAGVLEDMFSEAAEDVLGSSKRSIATAQDVEKKDSDLMVMREEISQFLVQCSRENISTRNLDRLNQLMRICNETASISDCCRKLDICAAIKEDKKIDFDNQGSEEIKTYTDLVKKFLTFNKDHLGTHMAADKLTEAEALENSIDKTRDILRKAAQKRLKTGHTQVKAEILFIDVLRHIEHVGDHSFEISRALYRMNSGRTPPAAAPALPVQI